MPVHCAIYGEEECAQMKYQCAEFVSRSLAAAGFIQNIDPYRSSVWDLIEYESYGVQYNLGFASKQHGFLGLKEYLENHPDRWQKFMCTPFLYGDDNILYNNEENRQRTVASGVCRPELIRAGTVVIMKNGRHSGVGVDVNRVNTHNPARFQNSFEELAHFPINFIFVPLFY